jgi:hypothetical protein
MFLLSWQLSEFGLPTANRQLYSVLKLLTGFSNADWIACTKTVVTAINNAAKAARANIHQLSSIR